VAISEHDRYELHKWLVDNAGEQVAETLMAHLPPVGWADVATKRDLEHLETVLRLELQSGLAGVDGEIHQLRGEMHLLRADFNEKLRLQLMVLVGFNLSAIGAVAALLR
jgi:Icc-related predicted phosphoesterase